MPEEQKSEIPSRRENANTGEHIEQGIPWEQLPEERREFLRKATAAGLSASTVALILSTSSAAAARLACW